MEEVKKYINDDGSFDFNAFTDRVREHLLEITRAWRGIKVHLTFANSVIIYVEMMTTEDFEIHLGEGALVSNEEIHRTIPALIDDYFKQKEKGEDMREIKRFKPDDNGEAFRRKLSNKIHLTKGYAMGATEICALVREGDEPRADAVFVVISEQCDEIIKMLEGVWGDNT